ncbi:calcium-dependent protein kinase 33 [Citrus sinensis]|nr:calcium-dependent protein kinase 33 [Citrus sinensis]
MAAEFGTDYKGSIMDQELPTTMDHELLNVLRREDEHQIRLLAVRMQNIFSTMSPRGNIVLHMAIRFQKHKVVQEILWRQLSLLRKNNWKGETALLIAARAGDPAIVSTLLNYVPAVKNGTEAEPESLLRMTEFEGNTSLHNGSNPEVLSCILCGGGGQKWVAFSAQAKTQTAQQHANSMMQFLVKLMRTFACKSISKRKLVKDYEKDDVRREVAVMQYLSGQPNIVKFKAAYEDDQFVLLLWNYVLVVSYLIELGVMHRDLRPENFLFTSMDENAVLNANDFGLSVFIEEETEQGVAQAILKGEINFQHDPFPKMDTDNSGTLTYDELREGLAKLGSTLTEFDVKQYMQAADIDGNGTIDYIEFRTAMTQRHKLERFEISLQSHPVDELGKAFKDDGMGDDATIATIKEIMSEDDRDKDGRISYDEFRSMMKRGTQL